MSRAGGWIVAVLTARGWRYLCRNGTTDPGTWGAAQVWTTYGAADNATRALNGAKRIEPRHADTWRIN